MNLTPTVFSYFRVYHEILKEWGYEL